MNTGNEVVGYDREWYENGRCVWGWCGVSDQVEIDPKLKEDKQHSNKIIST